MSYLKFDKTLLTNLEQSLDIEYLRTNRSGAYSCTSITDCNTRKYHGLLVTPIPELDNDNHVLLSTLDETVIQHGAEFNLGIHKYQGDTFAPRGHKYIREFDCELISKKTYRVGGVILTKESFLQHDMPRVLIRYTLVDAHSETTLRLRPQLAFRNVNALTNRNTAINYSYEEVPGGVTACLYKGYPTLYMQVSKEAEFFSAPDWNMGVEYPREQVRGYAYKEDLYMPGYFEMKIRKGESIVFAAGIKEADPKQLKNLFTRELKLRVARTSFFNCLKISAQSSIIERKGKDYIIAGYPWFKVRARDTFIALPGSTLVIGDKAEFEKVMATAADALRHQMEDPDYEDKVIQELSDPDIPLWATWAIQQYAHYVSTEEAAAKYGALLRDILTYIIDDHSPLLSVQENGLLYADGEDAAITWMNATEAGRSVTPRTGYIVEFNALWYNALKFTLQLMDEQPALMFKDDEDREVEKHHLQRLCELYEGSFAKTFTAQGGYLYDYVTEGYSDPDVRPNQIFALSLQYTPLSKPQRKAALDMVTKELLTPKGIRSLTPNAGRYRPNYWGNATERNYAYHNGAVWPWLLGAYTEAYLKVFTRSGIAFIKRRLQSYEEEMSRHCIGTLSEVYDGNPPFRGHGAMMLSINQAEVLRAIDVVEKYVPEPDLRTAEDFVNTELTPEQQQQQQQQ